MVKMNGCAAIDFRPSVSLFGRQGGGCRRFPFGKWRLLLWKGRIASTASVCTLAKSGVGRPGFPCRIASKSGEYPHRSLPFWQAMHGGTHFSLPANCETHLASNARVYTPVQSCWGNTPNPRTISEKSATLLRSCF